MKKTAHHSGLILAIIGAWVLVFAQLGAMNHAYSHVPHAEATLRDAHSAAHSICDDCLSFAPVLSTAGSPTLQVFIAPPARAIALQAIAASLLNNRLNLAFRSRAPPVHA